MENDVKSGKLTLGTKFAYGTADLGIAMVTAAIQFVLFFYYNKVLGMDPALVGTALLVGKFTWDAINDPLVGYISDRTRTRSPFGCCFPCPADSPAQPPSWWCWGPSCWWIPPRRWSASPTTPCLLN